MKYKAKDYARAIVGAKKFDVEVFLKLLERNGDQKKLKEIVAWVEKIKYKKVIIETARKAGVKWHFGKNSIVEEKINPELIAGVRIMVNGEKQLDFSLRNKLEQIFK